MDTTITLGISILLQIAAAVASLRLISITGDRKAWLLISGALLLMAFYCCVIWYSLISNGMARPLYAVFGWLVPVACIFMLAGIVWIAPLFHSFIHVAENIKEGEKRNRLVIDTISSGIIVTDMKGMITDVNRKLCEIFERSYNEIVGGALTDFFDEDNRYILKEKMAGYIRGDQEPYEIIWTCKDGRKVPTEVSPAHILDDYGFYSGSIAVITDITARKEAEDALRKIESSLAEAQRIARLGNWNWDIKANELHWSEEIYCIFGLSPQQFGKTYEDFLNSVHPEDRELVKKAVTDSLSEKKPFSIDHRIVLPDYAERHVHERAEVIVDENGESIRMIGTVQDITQRKLVEKALQRQAHLLELAHSAIIVRDINDRISFWNKGAEDIYGYMKEEAMGKLTHALLQRQIPVEQDGHDDVDAVLLREGRWQGEIVYTRRDGRSIVVSSRQVLQRDEDNKPIAILEINNDITERKRAEETLLESERRYRSLFENSRDAVYIVNPDGQFIEANQAALDLFGCTREEMVCKDFLKHYVHPEYLREFLEKVEKKESVKDCWIKFLGKDGTEIQCFVTSTIWRADDGTILGYQGIIRDVTELRLMEEKLLQSQKMEAIGRLAGGVAHDFNNLLVAIMGYIDFLMCGLEPGGLLHRYASEVHAAAIRAGDLTRQLLAFSRRQVLQPKVLDLNTVVGNLDSMLKRLIGEDINLATILGSELGRVKADPGQIEQVVMNLAVNARDAMPGGGKLTIETRNIDLDSIYAYRHVVVEPGSYVMLAVSDTGTGINEKNLPHIFEPFFTTKEKSKGTGLGLSTVYGIIKQSGGYIWAYSEPGCGTTFKIYLPRIEDAADPIKPQVSVAVPVNGTETILLVEDEDLVRKLIREALRGSGYAVLEACNGREALAICEKHEKPIHLMMTDVIMPAMGGCELVERIASLRPETKVLYMSGYTENSIVQSGKLESGTAFLPKPFTPDILKHKIREVLEDGKNQVSSRKDDCKTWG